MVNHEWQAHVDTELHHDETSLQIKIGQVALALVEYGMLTAIDAFAKAREIVGGTSKR